MSMHNGVHLSLPFSKVVRLAKYTCSILGIKPPTDAQMYTEYYSDIPIPIFLDNGGVYVWIDRYYIAYQVGFGDVIYVYLTKTHICEERASRIKLPPDIKRTFDYAFKQMNKLKTYTWVRDYDCLNKIGA